jgi:hypothetical protein
VIGLVGVVAFFVFYANWCDFLIDGWQAPRWKVWTAAASLAVLLGCFALYGPDPTHGRRE